MSKAERTKQFIIEKAAPIFNTKGVTGTFISDLMKATSLKKGGIYGNFESKDDIALAVFDYIMKQVVDRIRAKAAAQDSMAGKLNGILDFYVEYGIKPPVEGGCPILNFGAEVDDHEGYPELKKRVKDAINTLEHDLMRIVRKGIRVGEFKEDVNAADFATKFIVMVEGGILLTRIQKNQRPLQIAIKALRQDIEAIKVD
ncbi:MAG: TetR/AcrR family transcriptional regulator [Aureispira sp.]|nr:TetR/AcrR family transcriptional regulator [Aureispira sp.]